MREFVQLAQTFDAEKHRVGGWLVSEKLDGMRAYWDGGWTRGRPTSEVPFANTTKDFRRKDPPHSTGLWSRYGKPIAAPNWWLNDLPDFPLDGELYLGPGRFQELISIVKRSVNVNEADWGRVGYHVFDLPSDYAFLAPGTINNNIWTKEFEDWRHLAPVRKYGPMSLRKICRMIELGKIDLGTWATWITQGVLSSSTDAALTDMGYRLDDIVRQGGEGLVLRKPDSVWTPTRTWDLLKLKPWLDNEALVTGYKWGKNDLEGLMGSLLVVWQGKEFALSGFNKKDGERYLGMMSTGGNDQTPGSIVDGHWGSVLFPRGSTVTFRYRELTKDGIPKEARYWRQDDTC